MVNNKDKKLIRALQGDLPLCPRPFAAIGEKVGLSERAVLEKIHAFQNKKIMRKFTAILRHRMAGLRANCMAVWAVNGKDPIRLGTFMARFPEISHCYLRPALPDFPYNLYTMIHGKSKAEIKKLLRRLSLATGLTKFEALWSEKEFKKTSPVFFLSKPRTG